MKFVKAKLYIDKVKKVKVIPIKLNDNYYTDLRNYVNEGYKQIIVPSDAMIGILKKYFKERIARIHTIELLEEDSDYTYQLNQILESIEDNRDYFVDLIEELSYLSEKSTVEIKSIRFKYRLEDKPVDISISVNGILTYSENTITIKEIDNLKQDIIDLIQL